MLSTMGRLRVHQFIIHLTPDVLVVFLEIMTRVNTGITRVHMVNHNLCADDKYEYNNATTHTCTLVYFQKVRVKITVIDTISAVNVYMLDFIHGNPDLTSLPINTSNEPLLERDVSAPRYR